MSGLTVLYVKALNASKCGSTVKVGGRTSLAATHPSTEGMSVRLRCISLPFAL